MKLDTLRTAANLEQSLRRLEEQFEAIQGYHITAITVDTLGGNGQLNPVTLSKHGGTGSVNSIGFPKRLKQALDKALHEYFESEISETRGKLIELGVDVAA